MKYGIYKGSLIEIGDEDGALVHIIDDDITMRVEKGLIVFIDGLDGRLQELLSIKEEIRRLRGRIYKLEEEYNRKHEALIELYQDARGKEIKVINSIILGKEVSGLY